MGASQARKQKRAEKTAEKSAAEQLQELAAKAQQERQQKAQAIYERAVRELAAIGYVIDPGVALYASGHTEPLIRVIDAPKRGG